MLLARLYFIQGREATFDQRKDAEQDSSVERIAQERVLKKWNRRNVAGNDPLDVLGIHIYAARLSNRSTTVQQKG
jgi:cytochrome c biogenesis protein ResB